MIKYLRYVLEALGLFFIYSIFWLLPTSLASTFGGWLTRKVGPLLSASRTGYKNLRRILPNADHDRIMTGMWDNFGRAAAEYAHPDAFRHQGLVMIEGQDILDQIKDKPAIYFSAHFSNFQIISLMLERQGIPLVQISRNANNPLVDRLLRYVQYQAVSEVVSKGPDGLRRMLKALDAGKSLIILLDQKLNEGVSVPLLGYPAMTAPAAVRLALKKNCPLVPIHVERQEGARFKLIIEAPLTNVDQDGSLRAINDHMSQWIMAHPEQWLWVHNRWDF